MTKLVHSQKILYNEVNNELNCFERLPNRSLSHLAYLTSVSSPKNNLLLLQTLKPIVRLYESIYFSSFPQSRPQLMIIISK